MLRQTNEKYVRLGENRHYNNVGVLRSSGFLLLLPNRRGAADSHPHRSSRRDASSTSGYVYRSFRDSAKCILLHYYRWLHLQSGHLLARYQRGQCHFAKVSFTTLEYYAITMVLKTIIIMYD